MLQSQGPLLRFGHEEMKEKTDTLQFDESALRRDAELLSIRDRSAFAAACAQRLLPSYVKFSKQTARGNPEKLAASLGLLWDDLLGRKEMSDSDLQKEISSSLGLIPEDEKKTWVVEQAAADDAASAVAYALRTRLRGNGQDAAWAARRAYDAVTYYCQNVGIEPGKVKILDLSETSRNPLVQAELSRQHRDITELLQGTIALVRLRERAVAEAPEVAFR